MKVKIGPYINRWTTCRFEHWLIAKHHGKNFSWEVDEKDYTRFDRAVERLSDMWQIVLNYTVNLYIDRKQRKIKVHIDPYDCWGADHTLALIILPVLKMLKEKKQGSAMVDDEDVPEGQGLRSTEAPPFKEWETDDNIHKRWDYVMDKMIWAFEQIVDEDAEDQFHHGTIDFQSVPSKTNPHVSEWVKGPNDTWQWDREGQEKWQKEINEGLRLFGKYYQGLWD